MEIIQGMREKPLNMVLIGVPGIGKTTFAAEAPDPLFVGAEENDEIEAKRLKQVTTFAEFEEQLRWVRDTKPNVKTLVIDTLDSIEMLLHNQILAGDSSAKGNINRAHGGYGAALNIAAAELMRLRDQYLKPIRDVNGLNIIMLAHAKKTTAVDTLIGLQYDTYELNLHSKAQGIFVDWVSCVLFASYINTKLEDDNSDKVFAASEGYRVLLTEKRPGHLGKNRFNLPYELPFTKEDPFNPFMKLVKDFYAGKLPSPESVRQNIIGLLENIADNPKEPDFKTKVTASVEAAGDNVKRLMFIRDKLREVVGA